MNSEEVVLIGSIGAGVGAVAHDKLGISTGNALYDAIIGLVVAGVGYYTKYDGISDGIEGAGIGYFLSSIL